MSIRLSKACKDLNVGMSTALEFLAKKGHKLAHDPNLKLEDDLHLLLAKEFNKDMALKIESERLSQERHLKEKAATVALDGYNTPKPVEKHADSIHVTISEDQLPHFKPVGHIDLEAKNKRQEIKTEVHIPKLIVEKPVVVEEEITIKAEEPKVVLQEVKPEPKKEIVEIPVPKPIIEQPVVVKQPEKVVEKVVEAPKEEPKQVEEPKVEFTKPILKAEVKPAEIENQVAELNVETKDNDHEEDEVFSLARPTLDIAPVVIGTIDLELLNQSTRPKPKTKEQKRREREDKNKIATDVKKHLIVGEKKILRSAAEVAADPNSGHPKKKRERFSNQKVDITKVPQTTGPSQGLAHPKKVTPGTTGGGAGNANNKDRFKKQIKTAVNEVDVQD
jgi:translation initiation factor IF-2